MATRPRLFRHLRLFPGRCHKHPHRPAWRFTRLQRASIIALPHSPTAAGALRPGVAEGVETPPGSCPQGCVFASVALPHRNEIAIMRSAHFLWRSCHVQCDSTSEPTSGKQFARTLVRGLLWCRPGVVEGVETPLAVALRVGPRAARSSRGDGALRLVPSGASWTSGRIFGTLSLKAFAA